MRRARREAQGLTLVEMMVGLAVTAMLAAAATPLLANYLANARLREAGHAMLAGALHAQSEAIKRNRTVRLVASGSTVTVTDLGADFAPGADDAELRRDALAAGVLAGPRTMDFGSEGRLLPFPSAGVVDLSLQGGTCSAELRCPGLRVDVAGGVRLCANRLDATC